MELQSTGSVGMISMTIVALLFFSVFALLASPMASSAWVTMFATFVVLNVLNSFIAKDAISLKYARLATFLSSIGGGGLVLEAYFLGGLSAPQAAIAFALFVIFLIPYEVAVAVRRKRLNASTQRA